MAVDGSPSPPPTTSTMIAFLAKYGPIILIVGWGCQRSTATHKRNQA